MIIKLPLLLLSLLLANLPGLSAEAGPLTFTPKNGFTGKSTGEGSLKLLFARPRPFHVQSQGQSERDGSFTLKQTVTFQNEEAKKRTWSIREASPLRYTGTLSDAAGPVSGHTAGRRLVLKYRVKGPLTVHQTLDLSEDGATIINNGRITLLGIPLGSMHEIIRRNC